MSTRRQPGATGSWSVTFTLGLFLIAASTFLRPLFETHAWFLPAATLVAVTLTATAIVRSLSGSLLLSVLAGALSVAVNVGFHTAAPSLLEIPARWGEDATLVVDQIVSDAPPVRETEPMLLLVLVGLGALALLCDVFVFGLRAGAAAIAPAIVLPVLPLALGVRDIEGWAYVLTAVAFFLYLFAVTRFARYVADLELAEAGYLVDSRGLSGFASSALVIVLALVLAVVLPGALPKADTAAPFAELGRPALSTNRANPVLDLGDDLRRADAVEVLRYATTISSGELPYLSLTTLGELDGSAEWAPGPFLDPSEVESGDALPAPAPDSQASASWPRQQANIRLMAGTGAYLPRPGTAVTIDGLQGAYEVSRATGDIRAVDGATAAQDYTIETATPVFDEAGITQATARDVPASLEPLTSVPDTPAADRIRAFLDTIVTPGTSPYRQAVEVMRFLHDPSFTYSVTAPVEKGYDGTNLDVVERFLEVRAGYCVHYASTMAVMARMLGIPSRIVVGFTPGTVAEVNAAGQPVYRVTSDNLHAWAELYVPGSGWTPFETTPASGLGNLAAPTTPQSTADASPSATPEPTGAAAQPDAGATPSPGASGNVDVGSGSPAQPPVDVPTLVASTLVPVVLAVLLVVAVLLAVLLAPALARTAVRSRRRALVSTADAPRPDAGEGARGASSSPAAALVAWREVCDEALDLGIRVPATANHEEQADALVAALSGPGRGGAAGAAVAPESAPDLERALPAVRRLREAADFAAFAGPRSVFAPTSADVRASTTDAGGALDPEGRPADALDDGLAPGLVDGFGAGLWHDVETVEEALRAASTRSRRLRARFAPASLVARRAKPSSARPTTSGRSAGTAPQGASADAAEPERSADADRRGDRA